MTTPNARTAYFTEMSNPEMSDKDSSINFKALEAIDFSDPKNALTLAQFVFDEIKTGHCQDLTEPGSFTFSKAIKEKLLNGLSHETLEKILISEKNRVYPELDDHLKKLWENYIENVNTPTIESQSFSKETLKGLEDIEKNSFQRVLADIKKEIALRDEEIEVLAKNYAQFLEKNNENIINATHPEYSRLITQLKLKIKKTLEEKNKKENNNKADLTLFKSIADENLLEELKKMGIDLKQREAKIDQTTPEYSLHHKDLVAMTLDKLENRLPLELYVDTYLVATCAKKIGFSGTDSMGAGGYLYALLLILFIRFYHNWKNEQQQITDAIIATIKKNKVPINPDEIKVAIKVPKNKDTVEIERKKFGLLDKPYRDQILKANEELKKVEEKESEEHAGFNPFHHCLR